MREVQNTTPLTADQLASIAVHMGKVQEEAEKSGVREYAQYMKHAAQVGSDFVISSKAAILQFTQGSRAAAVYTAQQKELADVDLKIQQAKDRKKPLEEEEIRRMREAANATAEYAGKQVMLNDAITRVQDAVTAGTTAQESMRKKVKEAEKAFDDLRKAAEAAGEPFSEKKIRQFEAGIESYKRSVEPLTKTMADATKQWSQNLVDFVINADQSFSEFAANAIKQIGAVIAKMLMLQALESAFAGTRWASLFKIAEKGMVVDRGNVLPFQHGGVVAGPATFPLRGGQRGLMGEAGPEAVMPLARLPGGDLGVRSQPMNIELINNTGVSATARVMQDNERTQIIFEAAQLGATMAASQLNQSITSGYGASATTMQRTYGLTRRKA
jgi:hypothetical protein